MAVNFRQLLAKPLDDVKRPPAYPAGTYYGTLSRFAVAESRFGDRETGEKHAVVNFTITNARPGEDVTDDPTAAAVFAAANEASPLAKKALVAEMPISGGNEWITKSFIESLGVSTTGRGFGETLPETVNHEVMFTLTQRVDKNNPEVMFNDVRSLRAVPAAA